MTTAFNSSKPRKKIYKRLMGFAKMFKRLLELKFINAVDYCGLKKMFLYALCSIYYFMDFGKETQWDFPFIEFLFHSQML